MSSDFISDIEIKFNDAAESKIHGKIREHHPAHAWSTAQTAAREFFGVKGRNLHKTGAGGISTTPFYMAQTGGKFLCPDENVDFLEWRFPHPKKGALAAQFLGLGGGHHVVELKNASDLYVTYGKMRPYSSKVLSAGGVAGMAKDGLDAGMQIGETTAALAAVGTVATAGLTLGVGVAVVGAAVALSAANNHRENLRNRQVFVRVSRSRLSTRLGSYFSYEEKIYRVGQCHQKITFAKLARFIESGVIA